MRIVLDASAAIRAIIDADSELLEILSHAETIMVPNLYLAEVGNVFLQYVKHKLISYDTALEYIQDAYDLITLKIDESTIVTSAFKISLEYQLSYYDSLYLAIAIESDSKLLTRDKKLVKVSKKLGVNI